MQPHQKRGSIKPFKSYLDSLKPKPKLTEQEIKERNRRSLYMREKFKKTERFRKLANE